MDSKNKLIADALDLLNDIGFNHIDHDHTCYDDDDEDFKCYCGLEEILGKIADLNKRQRLLAEKNKQSS